MNVGDWIKWTGTDEDGEFSYTGQVINQNDVWIEFRTNEGTMTIKRTETITPAKPIELMVEALFTLKSEKVETKTKKQPGAGTKLERAVNIYKSMKNPTRQELIAAFVSQLQMTSAGASTYAAAVKRKAA